VDAVLMEFLSEGRGRARVLRGVKADDIKSVVVEEVGREGEKIPLSLSAPSSFVWFACLATIIRGVNNSMPGRPPTLTSGAALECWVVDLVALLGGTGTGTGAGRRLDGL
jgi:hypothetical protein